MDVDLCHFVIGHADFGGIGFVVEPGCHAQAGSAAGAANESEHGVQRPQRLTRPVGADRTKEAMFHRIPFRRPGGIMADGDLQAVRIRPALQFPFPQAATIAVAAAGVGFNKNLPDSRICPFAASAPPLTQRIDGELGCFRRDADAYVPGIAVRLAQ